MRALSVAQETYMRCNDKGMTCIQHQIVSAGSKKCFVDFLMLPTADDGDVSDDEARTTSA
jgi:hypothetical protein